MNKLAIISVALVLAASWLAGQNPPTPAPTPAKPAENYSGMYSFLQEGEFVQITVEDEGHVTGFISRYGDLDSDKGFELPRSIFQTRQTGRQNANLHNRDRPQRMVRLQRQD